MHDADALLEQYERSQAAPSRWSAYQEAIFHWFANPGGFGSSTYLLVRARAGTGKTTTICEGVNRAPEQNIWVAAFNADIVKDVTPKITNPRASAKTCHGIGLACIKRHWKGETTDLDKDRGFKIAEEVLRDRSLALSIPLPERLVSDVLRDAAGREILGEVDRRVVGLVANLATRVKEVEPFAKTAKECEDVALDYDLGPDEDYELRGWTTERVAAYALRAVQEAARFRDRRYDFADMIFLPLVCGWTYPRFDMTVIDEAQDMSKPMLEFARRMTKRGGRIALVGDDRQAIYGFRGADAGALDRLKEELDADELPLSITYRCPTLVVDHARRLVPDFQARAGAPEGHLMRVAKKYPFTDEQCGVLGAPSRSGLYEALRPGDLVLSRVNAGLMGVCVGLLRLKKPVQILGREGGVSLEKLIKKIAPECLPLDEFLEELREFVVDMTARLEEAKDRAARRRIEKRLDDAEAVVAIAEGLDEGVPGVRPDTLGLLDQVRKLFSEADRRGVVTCSTIHKVKGLEADRVFVLQDTLYVYGSRRKDPEEANLEYVAVTRAKSVLVLVGEVPTMQPNRRW